MKKIVLIIVIGLFEIVNAQTEIPIQNQISNSEPLEKIVYFKDTNNILNKFTGAWEYSDATNYLKIIITKKIHEPKGKVGIYNDNDFEDLLEIQVLFKENGIVKYNTKGNGGNFVINPNKLTFIYYKPSLTSCYRAKSANLQLEIINNNDPFTTDNLIWTRINSSLINRSECYDGSALDNTDFLIPSNLVLTKL